jgi:hypothetical protein
LSTRTEFFGFSRNWTLLFGNKTLRDKGSETKKKGRKLGPLKKNQTQKNKKSGSSGVISLCVYVCGKEGGGEGRKGGEGGQEVGVGRGEKEQALADVASIN